MIRAIHTTPRPLKLRKLRRAFFLQPTLRVARQLTGKYLVRQTENGTLIGKIIEVEAYLGGKDPASHAYRGKTKRNEVMFRRGGYLYVYFTYGMHHCCNVVTEGEGIGHAILLRAVEPIAGITVMMRNRRFDFHGTNTPIGLCSGPAKLCQAFGITRRENGLDLCRDDISIAESARDTTRHAIVRTPRIGISRGVTHKWRFVLRNNPYASR